MNFRKVTACAIAAAAFIGTLIIPCCAASGNLAQGVALYNKGEYRQALPLLEKAVTEHPYDSTSHYYLGLCYQAAKQNGPARQHFQYVVTSSKDAKLRSFAATALGGIPAARSSGSTSAPVAPVQNAVAAATPSEPSAAKTYGRCKVIMFETSWCHYCHEFAPDFDATGNQFRGKMDFQRVDAEQDKTLADKYGVHSYPRLVYLDQKGNVIYNEGRGGFHDRVKELTGG